MSGRLTIVGTGITFAAQMTIETKSIIESADIVLYVVADPATEGWIKQLNPNHFSMYDFYDEKIHRLDTYLRMTECILEEVRKGKNVCAVFYGHPGVFVFPGHEAIIRARREGYHAEMKASVSAEDCIFSDLGIDPGRVGCQAFEATDLLVHERVFDPRSLLIIWQVGVVGQMKYGKNPITQRGVRILRDYLLNFYSNEQRAYIYEASVFPGCDPVIKEIALSELEMDLLSQISTLVIPPSAIAVPNPAILRELEIPESYVVERKSEKILYDPMKPNIQGMSYRT